MIKGHEIPKKKIIIIIFAIIFHLRQRDFNKKVNFFSIVID